MNRDAVLALIADTGIVPSLRLSSADDARFAAYAVAEAGIPVVEVTLTTPGALSVISDVAKARPDIAIGAGTVLDTASARQCIDAGARFLTSPGIDTAVIEFAAREQVLVIPGVLTPTEIMAAHRVSADVVKIFPCAPWDGAAYLKSLAGPFPSIRFIASGGVNQHTAADFIRAGAVAVGVGSELMPRRAIEERDQRWITELGRRFLALIRDARNPRTRHDELLDRR